MFFRVYFITIKFGIVVGTTNLEIQPKGLTVFWLYPKSIYEIDFLHAKLHELSVVHIPMILIQL